MECVPELSLFGQQRIYLYPLHFTSIWETEHKTTTNLSHVNGVNHYFKPDLTIDIKTKQNAEHKC